jgi:hypothetical protein
MMKRCIPLQGTRRIGPSCPPRRCEPEQNASQYGDRDGKSKDAKVGRRIKGE